MGWEAWKPRALSASPWQLLHRHRVGKLRVIDVVRQEGITGDGRLGGSGAAAVRAHSSGSPRRVCRVVVGPHWPISLCTFAALTVPTWLEATLLFSWPLTLRQACVLVACCVTLCLMLATALRDPGVLLLRFVGRS